MSVTHNKGGLLIIVVGESCVGKTTLENFVVKTLRFKQVDIFTTRKRRDDDLEHYHFLSEEEFYLYNDFELSFKSSEDTMYGYKLNKNEPYQVVSFISPINALNLIKSIKEDYSQISIFGLIGDKDKIKKCIEDRNGSASLYNNRDKVTNLNKIDTIVHRDDARQHVINITDEYIKKVR